MKFRFGKTIRDRRLDLKLTLSTVAKNVGCAEQTIQRIETGAQKNIGFVLGCKICRFLNLDPFSLADGTIRTGISIIYNGEERYIENKAELPIAAANVPVITWEEAGDQIKRFSDLGTFEGREIISVGGKIGLQSYALIMQGDSMHNPFYAEHSFNDGDYIVLDPDKEAKINSFVLVRKIGRPTALFRQLILNQGEKTLKPLNPMYSPETFTDEHKIVAVYVYRCSYAKI